MTITREMTVIVVDDHRAFVETLARAVSAAPGLRWAGAAKSAHEARSVLMDLPGEQAPDLAVVALKPCPANLG